MKKSDFFFELPAELIAQPRFPAGRLAPSCIDKSNGAVAHLSFHDLPSLLWEGDAWF
jgi:S-adenosylmethionine:tRNA-ribosyltransferase-isomerase (queuine synthetase)